MDDFYSSTTTKKERKKKNLTREDEVTLFLCEYYFTMTLKVHI